MLPTDVHFNMCRGAFSVIEILSQGMICRPLHTSLRMRGLYEKVTQVTGNVVNADTLVIYVYSKTDPEYERNLQFFVEHGMWEGDGCEYLIIVQQVGKTSIYCQIKERAWTHTHL